MEQSNLVILSLGDADIVDNVEFRVVVVAVLVELNVDENDGKLLLWLLLLWKSLTSLSATTIDNDINNIINNNIIASSIARRNVHCLRFCCIGNDDGMMIMNNDDEEYSRENVHISGL